MPVVGLLIGQVVAGPIGHVGRYVGAALLILTGAYTVWQSRKTGEVERAEEKGALATRELTLLAIALSIDNLVVGFALGVYRIPILLAAAVMAGVSVAMSLIGLELGSRLGSRVGEYSELAGGGVLILVGLAIGAGLI